MEQSHGGAGGAEGEEESITVKASNQQCRMGRRGKEEKGADRAAPSTGKAEGIGRDDSGEKRRGSTGRAEMRDTQMTRAGRKQHGRAGQDQRQGQGSVVQQNKVDTTTHPTVLESRGVMNVL